MTRNRGICTAYALAIVGAGLPAKKTPRWMARASPVFAGKPAPTGWTAPQKLDSFKLQPEPCTPQGSGH
ncbi:hypothetical protein CRM86_02920 [Pseudomonas putida]|nr:hypothetical protein CRM86_02920 [Pseudomonas putida]